MFNPFVCVYAPPTTTPQASVGFSLLDFIRIVIFLRWNTATILNKDKKRLFVTESKGLKMRVFLKRRRRSLSPGAEPDPGPEGREEPHPAGADAPGGGGAPLRRAGTRGHPRQRLHTNLPLQAALFLLLVVGPARGRGWTSETSRALPWRWEPWRRLGAASSRGRSTPALRVGWFMVRFISPSCRL